MDQDASFGAWLAQRRHALGLSRPQLARRVNCVAITLRKIEEDARRPSQDLAAQLAIHLSILPEERATFIRVARGDIPVAWLPLPDRPAMVAPPPVLGARPTRLPIPPTPLLGRAAEVAAVRAMLLRDGVRLLTLTGPPGIGKTRLSLQVATELQAVGADGLTFVPLAPVRDPGLVLTTIAQTLGIIERAGQSVRDGLTAALRELRLLLVLDNFEQVLPAAPQLMELLAAVPGLTLLVTSRVALRLSGEHRFAVPPLSLPPPADAAWDGRGGDTGAAIVQYAAVELFVQRARAVLPAFVVTVENSAAVAGICRALDGLPLAIELAAVRITLFSPQALLTRLSHRLDLLTAGALDLPERQQTLRRAIAWSYDLLNAGEQAVFRRLSVFVGGCTLPAAEAVCTAGTDLSIGILDGMAALVDTSLLRREAGGGDEARFVMLETVREYARERLEACGEQSTLQRHADYFLAWAERGWDQDHGDGQVSLFDHWEHEHDNLRAALEWSHAESAADIELRLATVLTQFWVVRGYASEGWARLTAALVRRNQVAAAVRARALSSVVLFAVHLGGQLEQVGLYLEEGLALMQQLGDRVGIAWAHSSLGGVAALQGDYRRALERITQSLALYRALDNTWGMCVTHAQLGEVALLQGDVEHAGGELEQSLTLCRQSSGATWAMARRMTLLGEVVLAQGGSSRARELFVESLRLCRDSRDKVDIPMTLVGLAGVARVEGQLERAARLLGAGERVRATSGAFRGLAGDVIVARATAAIRAEIDAASFATAWSEGRAMTLEQAVAYALASTD